MTPVQEGARRTAKLGWRAWGECQTRMARRHPIPVSITQQPKILVGIEMVHSTHELDPCPWDLARPWITVDMGTRMALEKFWKNGVFLGDVPQCDSEGASVQGKDFPPLQGALDSPPPLMRFVKCPAISLLYNFQTLVDDMREWNHTTGLAKETSISH